MVLILYDKDYSEIYNLGEGRAIIIIINGIIIEKIIIKEEIIINKREIIISNHMIKEKDLDMM